MRKLEVTIKTFAGLIVIAVFSVMTAALFFNGGILTQNAYAIGGTLDQTLCESLPGPAVWNEDTCTISTPVTINSGETLTIPSGVTFIVKNHDEGVGATVNNEGTIDNAGVIDVNFIDDDTGIGNSGTIDNSGTITLNNENIPGTPQGDATCGICGIGDITNSGTITVSNSGGSSSEGIRITGDSSKFINSGTITVSNSGSSDGIFSLYTENTGTITVSNSGSSLGFTGGDNRFRPGDSLINSGTITVSNSGGIGLDTVFGTITNRNIIDISAGGTFRIGHILNNENDGTINNHGTISIIADGTVSNDGEITNFAGGEINNAGTFNINDGGILTINSGSTLDNELGVVMVFCGGILENGGGTIIGDITSEDCDSDGDGVTDESDNCPDTANEDQADLDSDGIGNACDTENLVSIDIKPGGLPNSINLKNEQTVTVGILGTSGLNVKTVDISPLADAPKFGGATPQSPTKVNSNDVNKDGSMDLVLQYKVAGLGFSKSSTQGCISGKLLDGTAFEGCEKIKIVPK